MQTPYDPPSGPLSILHEDRELVAVEKPAGLLSVPGRGVDLADCLLNRVQLAFPDALLVHRLDRDTSGRDGFCTDRPCPAASVDAV
jgi:tRNA pseudouridine32 synthase/23S rRNA pseudouridine746 synthase